MKNLSLKARLLLLIILSYLTLAVPILLYCANSLEDLAVDREKDEVRIACSQMHRLLDDRFAYKFQSRVERYAAYKAEMLAVCRYAAGALASGGGITSDAERLKSVSSVLAADDIHYAVYDRLEGFVYGSDLVVRQFAGDVRDSKGRRTSSMLNKPLLASSGSTELCILHAKAVAGAPKEEADTSLLCLTYVNERCTLVLYTPLLGLSEELNIRRKSLEKDMQQRADSIELHAGYTLALADADDKRVFVCAGAEADQKRVTALLRNWDNKYEPVEKSYMYEDRKYYGRAMYVPSYHCYIILSVPMSVVLAPGMRLLAIIAVISVAGLVVGLAAVYRLAAGMVRPLEALTDKADELSRVDLNGSDGMATLRRMGGDIPENPGNEEGRLAAAFGHMAAELEVRITRAIEGVAARKAVEGELAAARKMQLGMLSNPNACCRIRGVCISTCIRPAREVAGDFYDFIPLGDGRLALIIGDVSGKGVASSLFMAMSVAYVRQSLRNGLSCAQAMMAVNANLAYGNDAVMFVTLFICTLDPATGRLEYCSGGHCAPAVFSAAPEGGRPHVRYLRACGGPLVGVFPEAVYTSSEDMLAPGECCLLYTDGVTEAMNSSSDLFGEDRLTKALGCARSPEDAVAIVLHAIKAHADGAGQSDDITMLCFGSSCSSGGCDFEGAPDAGAEKGGAACIC